MVDPRNGDTMGRPLARISSAAASPSPVGATSSAPTGARPIPKPPPISPLEQRAAHGDRDAEQMLHAWADVA